MGTYSTLRNEPLQCPFHCTKPDISAAKQAVHALLLKVVRKPISKREGQTYAKSAATVRMRVMKVKVLNPVRTAHSSSTSRKHNATKAFESISKIDVHVFYFIRVQAAVSGSW